MKTIACLAAAAALAGLAASASFGCQSKGPPQASAGDPPAAPGAPAAPNPSAAPPAPPAEAAPTSGAASPAAGAPPSKEYASDIEKLCDVVRLSGAPTDPAEDRRVPIAQWLGANLTTPESRKFLAYIQPLGGAEKADALDAEARRVGLAGCNLAAEWRSPPTR